MTAQEKLAEIQTNLGNAVDRHNALNREIQLCTNTVIELQGAEKALQSLIQGE